MKVSTSTEGRVRAAELTGVAPRTMRDTWEIVSDTSRLNEVVFGMPPLTVVEFNSLSARAAISFLGYNVEYEEQAWEYEAPSRFRSVRVFTSGPLVRLESVCVLSTEGEGTRVSFSLRLTAKEGPLGFGAAKLLMPKLEDGLGKLGAVLSSPHQTLRSFHRPAQEAETRARAEPFRAPLLASSNDRIVSALLDDVASLAEEEVTRLRPYDFAERRGFGRSESLDLFLHAVRAGLLTIRWDALCCLCRQPKTSVERWEDAPARVACNVCHEDTELTRTSNLEAVFAPAAGVRQASASTFCVGSPRRTPHWVAQVVLDPGTERMLRPTLGAGRYLVRSPGIPVATLVDVGSSGEERVRVTLEGPRAGLPATLPRATPLVQEGAVSLVLKNEDGSPRRLVLMNEGFGDLAATVAHVVETPVWRTLFAS